MSNRELKPSAPGLVTKKSKELGESVSVAPAKTGTNTAPAGGNIIMPAVPSMGSGNVNVVCRVRPTNKKELEMNLGTCVEFNDEKTISLKTSANSEAGPGNQKFVFDRVFPMNCTQENIYHFAAKPVVNSVLEGFNGTVFAYGQTSSGKTHTMQGPSIDDLEMRGIIPRMVNTVFDHISSSPEHIEWTVKVSIVEIYLEKIRDLISPEKSNLKVREDKARGIYIEDVTETYVANEMEVYDCMKLGASNRAISATNMNEGSSRSHSIFMMSISQNNLHELSFKTGKLYLVDLAGSEKIGKTGAAGQTLEEAKMINKSLSALGNVINALTESKTGQHIPYRDSKLTRILQESLGGNSRTTLIITCSPSPFNEQETLSTLRFGYRAKSIKNNAKINREYTVPELKLLLDKAEKTLEQKEKRIKVLEHMIVKNGLPLPKDNEFDGDLSEAQTILTTPPQSAEETEANLESDSDERNDLNFSSRDIMSNIQMMTSNDDQARIRLLESELEQERNNVRTQTEKVNMLRREFAAYNLKLNNQERENEALITKLATLSVTINELEERFKAKETEFNYLQELKDTLMQENENLKKIQEDLAEEKNALLVKEAQAISGLPNKALVEDFASQMMKELSSKFNISDENTLKDIASNYLSKFQASLGEGDMGGSGSETKRTRAEIAQELLAEKEKNAKLESDYQKLKEQYEKAGSTKTPLKTGKYGMGEGGVLNDEKDKLKVPGSNLVQNLDQLSNMYQQIAQQKSQTRVEQAGDKKPQRKTERILNLEKQLHETKDLVNQYKTKIESLKSLISVSTSTNNTGTSFLDKSVVDIQKKRDLVKQEVKDNVSKDSHIEELHMKGPQTRIVKHIRGGSKFTNILKQGQTPSQSRGPEDWESAEKSRKESDERILAGLSDHK